MSEPFSKLEFTRFAPHGIPTPDAMMTALFEQQKMLGEKDELLAESQSQIQNQQARIAVLEEMLQLMKQRKFGSNSEKNLLQEDWLADEAETLADGGPDSDDREVDSADEQDGTGGEKKPRKRNKGKGLSADLPRIQRFVHMSDEEREGAIDTFFVKIKEELDIIPAQVQVIEIMQEKAVFLDEYGERSLKAAERPPHPIGRSLASVNL